MSIPAEKIQSIWETFTGEYLTPAECDAMSVEVDSYSDLLAKILLDTDFLDQYPAVEKVLRTKAPRVMRSLTDEPVAALQKTVKTQQQQLRAQLFEKQQHYTSQLNSLVELEREIIYLRKILSSYQ